MNKLMALVLVGTAALAPAAHAESPVLVELFTSQGCSSCPSADKVLDRLVDRPDVITLAYHVTYWDRLGWKDTLGDPAYDQRQYSYGRLLKSDSVYTPQAVIGGKVDAVGSNGSRVDAAIKLLASRQDSAVTLKPASDGQSVTVDGKPGESARLLVATYQPDTTVAIKRGELAGSTFVYRRAVSELTNAGSWEGGARTIDVGAVPAGGGAVVFVQSNSDGAVLAAIDVK